MSGAPALRLTLRGNLPAALRPVADLLGDDGLLRLLEAHGGTRLWVPARVGAHDPLATLLGVRPARRLASAFGGERLAVPLAKEWRALMLRRQGLSYAAIGLRMGMHEQSVYRLVHRNEAGGMSPAERRSLGQLELDLASTGKPR